MTIGFAKTSIIIDERKMKNQDHTTKRNVPLRRGCRGM